MILTLLCGDTSVWCTTPLVSSMLLLMHNEIMRTYDTRYLSVKEQHMSLIAGCLIHELFSGGKLSRTEDLRNIASIPKVSLHDCVLGFGLFLSYLVNISF